jgi:hypothetical protein
VRFRVLAGLSDELSDGLPLALTLVIRLATLWFATLIGIVGSSPSGLSSYTMLVELLCLNGCAQDDRHLFLRRRSEGAEGLIVPRKVPPLSRPSRTGTHTPPSFRQTLQDRERAAPGPENVPRGRCTRAPRPFNMTPDAESFNENAESRFGPGQLQGSMASTLMVVDHAGALVGAFQASVIRFASSLSKAGLQRGRSSGNRARRAVLRLPVGVNPIRRSSAFAMEAVTVQRAYGSLEGNGRPLCRLLTRGAGSAPAMFPLLQGQLIKNLNLYEDNK